MALGGGTFISQNKKLPGTYINFVSAARATASLSDRGAVAMPLELNWGRDGEIFTVTQADFIKNSMVIFGYPYDADELKGLRDLFLNAQVGYFYKLTSGGSKASNTYAEALYCGTRGNDLKVVIAANVDDEDLFDVSLYMDTTLLDTQTVASASQLVANDYVSYKATATLEATAGVSLTGGANGNVNGAAYQSFIDKIESYSFNVLGVVTTDTSTLSLFAAFTKRMRDEVGSKFQTVLYNKAADYEGVINLKNTVSDTGANAASLVYWLTGVEAACGVNASCTNRVYDGEYTVLAGYTQAQLETAIDNGELALHKVGDDIRILTDINSLVNTTDTKGDDFKSN